MYLVAIAWTFVAVLMAAAEATSPQGSLLGALVTLLLYGALPLAIVLYVMAAPLRRRARQRAEAAASIEDRDRGRHSAGAPVAPEREEP